MTSALLLPLLRARERKMVTRRLKSAQRRRISIKIIALRKTITMPLRPIRKTTKATAAGKNLAKMEVEQVISSKLRTLSLLSLKSLQAKNELNKSSY